MKFEDQVLVGHETYSLFEVRTNSSKVDAADPARYLAYNTYVNLNNMMYEFWRAIKFANIAELNNQDEFIKVSSLFIRRN